MRRAPSSGRFLIPRAYAARKLLEDNEMPRAAAAAGGDAERADLDRIRRRRGPHVVQDADAAANRKCIDSVANDKLRARIDEAPRRVMVGILWAIWRIRQHGAKAARVRSEARITVKIGVEGCIDVEGLVVRADRARIGIVPDAA